MPLYFSAGTGQSGEWRNTSRLEFLTVEIYLQSTSWEILRYALYHSTIRFIAMKILNKRGDNTPLGNGWIRSFLSRNPINTCYRPRCRNFVLVWCATSTPTPLLPPHHFYPPHHSRIPADEPDYVWLLGCTWVGWRQRRRFRPKNEAPLLSPETAHS